MRYTKGPWIAAPYSSVVGAPVVSRSGRPVAKIIYFESLGEGFENHERESDANARLIAAAPELLEALEEMIKWYAARDLDDEIAAMPFQKEEVRRAMIAISKAKGE